MRVCAVIAEYDPFHNGHMHHLRQSRALTGADFVLCILSGAFTQRGMPSLVPIRERTKMALEGGADAVISLPVSFSCASAERFAKGAIRILDSLGVADFLAFGCETPDLELLQRAAHDAQNEPDEQKRLLNQALSRGISYPAAMAGALTKSAHLPDDFLQGANNMLAMSYLRVLKQLNSPIAPVPIRRLGAHNQQNADGFQSASFIRKQIESGVSSSEWDVPPFSRDILETALQKGALCFPNCLSQALLYRLNQLSDEDLRQYPDVSEGIEHRILQAAKKAKSTGELLMSVKTKRFSYARLSRICAYALLDLKKEGLEEYPAYTQLLGFRQDARMLLRKIHENSAIPVIAKPAREKSLLQYDARAAYVRSLGTAIPCRFFEESPMILRSD